MSERIDSLDQCLEAWFLRQHLDGIKVNDDGTLDYEFGWETLDGQQSRRIILRVSKLGYEFQNSIAFNTADHAVIYLQGWIDGLYSMSNEVRRLKEDNRTLQRQLDDANKEIDSAAVDSARRIGVMEDMRSKIFRLEAQLRDQNHLIAKLKAEAECERDA